MKSSIKSNGSEYTLVRLSGIIISVIGIFFILFGDLKTPENFRILSDIIQNILILNLISFLFLPSNQEFQIAVYVGIFTMIFDFILETVAVYSHWWYPLGGTQFPPLVVIPLEMVLSFLLIGTSMGILFRFPQKCRELNSPALNWLRLIFKKPKYDNFWRIGLILLNAVIGLNGDYSAGTEIWKPGKTWHPLYTFFVWFGGGLLILGFFNMIENKYSKIENQ